MAIAGEEVALGKERTGAAQILGSPVNVWGQVFAQQRQQKSDEALAMRQAMEAAKLRDKQAKDYLDDLSKIDKPWQVQAEYVARQANDIRTAFQDIMDTGGDVATAREATARMKDELISTTARTKANGEILRIEQANLKRDPFYDEDYGLSILSDSLMTEDPTKSDQETAKRVTEHPRVYNSDFALDNWSKGIKNSLSTGLGAMENSGLGLYRDVNTQEVKFHKGKDANGNYIPGVSDQMLDQALASDPRVGDRYLWEAVAKNNGLDQRIDRAEIDKKFLEIKDNPPKEYVQEVRRRAEAALLKNQVEKERFSAQRFGQNPRPKTSSPTSGFTVLDDGETFDVIEELPEVGDDKVTGFVARSLPVSNIAVNVAYKKDKTGDFVGIYTNNKGEPVLRYISKEDGDEVQEDIPYSKESIATLRNAIKSEKTRAKFDEAVKEFFSEKPKEAVLDEDKLQRTTGEVYALWSNRDQVNNDPDGLVRKTTAKLKSLGIPEASIEYHRNIGGQWIGMKPKIKIDGSEWFDPLSEEGKKIIKEKAYKLNPKAFSKPKSSKASTQESNGGEFDGI